MAWAGITVPFRNLSVVDGGTRCEYRNLVWKPANAQTAGQEKTEETLQVTF